MSTFDLATKQREIDRLEELSAQPDFWSNQQDAQEVLQKITRLRSEVEPWVTLQKRTTDLLDLIHLCEVENDASLCDEINRELTDISAKWKELYLSTLFSGEYDHCNAFLSVNSGAGGTEAMDWCEMLARMYARWAEAKGFTTEIIDSTPGEEAGLKSVTMVVRGHNAYGHLRAERGVHRLVRLSPFDANHRRHTSFASVDVVPELDADIQVEINPDDLKVETFRASSAGGQHVQKNETAVRITHIPTGIVVQCQNERSQHQNKAVAMKILQARLFERELQKQKSEIEKLRGEQSAIAWGSQIRSYVFHPYNMVKDHRTEYETSNVQAVMNGEIDDFIRAYLEMAVNRTRKT